MADTTRERAVFVLAGEPLAIGCGVKVCGAVCIPFHRDRGNGDGRTYGESFSKSSYFDCESPGRCATMACMRMQSHCTMVSITTERGLADNRTPEQ